MSKDALEDSIITKIVAFTDAAKVAVLPYPDNEAEFSAVTTKNRIYVGIDEADYSKPKSTAETAQEVTDKYDLWLISKRRRGDNGVHSMYQLLTDNLIGFTPPNSGRIFGLKFKFEFRLNGAFYYRFTIGTLNNVVQNFTEVVGANVTELEFNYEPPA
jgi:hypothetical protein